jgi:Uma2 family endonuclease
MSVQIARRHFNISEYYRMTEAGILSEGDRVELLDGEVVEMSPIGSRHAACVNRLNQLLNRLVLEDVIVSIQNPIVLNEYSEPQPDISLLRPRPDFYAQGHPTPADVLLVVEVADSSTQFDREIKLPLYTQAMLPEVWLVNLPDDAVECYSQPTNGAYQVTQTLKRGESLVSPASTNLNLDVNAILG